MPIPLLLIGGVAAAASLGMTAHSAWKQRKSKRIHDERLAEVLIVQNEAETAYDGLIKLGEQLGRAQVQASKTLEDAALYLRAVAKQFQAGSLPNIPNDILAEWISLRSEMSKTLGLGVTGSVASAATAGAGSALYTAAGLFGVASTGTRIAGLSGAAAHKATLAWIGGGAVATGGGGVALGGTILNVLSKANVVMAPIAIATAVWGEKKAHDFEKKVTAKLVEFDEAEKKFRSKITAMSISTRRIKELLGSVENTDRALQDLLKKARSIPAPESDPVEDVTDGPAEPDFHIPHQIYMTAKTLRELIEQPGISEDVRRIIEE